MGRTQATYRMRLQSIRDRYQKYFENPKYSWLWEVVHNLSAPSSTLPYPDTHAVASFCMILELIAKTSEIQGSIVDI